MKKGTKRPRNTQELSWKEPPPKAAGRGFQDPAKETLKAHPGKWACIRTFEDAKLAAGTAGARRRSWGADYEIASRGCEVYARFVGKKK